MGDQKRVCKWCRESINESAIVCRHCGRDQNRIVGYIVRYTAILTFVAFLGSAYSWYAADREATRAEKAVEIAENAAELADLTSSRGIRTGENLSKLTTVVGKTVDLIGKDAKHNLEMRDLLHDNDWRESISDADNHLFTYLAACYGDKPKQDMKNIACEIMLSHVVGSVAISIIMVPMEDQASIDSACFTADYTLGVLSKESCTDCGSLDDIEILEKFVSDNNCSRPTTK